MVNPSSLYTNDKYFQAILQLRPATAEMVDFVMKQLKENKVTIGNVIEKNDGLDLYLSDQRFTIGLAKKLKKRFKGTVKITRSIHTKNRLTSRNVYRPTALFRLTKPL